MNGKPNPEATLLTVEQVASLVQVSTRTVWRLVSSGDLVEPIRMGGNTRWRRADLDAWIAAGCPSVGRGGAIEGR